jgi:hypothetical protein
MSHETCKCGQPIKYAGETRCEDCYVDDAARFHGKSQSVNTFMESEAG